MNLILINHLTQVKKFLKNSKNLNQLPINQIKVLISNNNNKLLIIKIIIIKKFNKFNRIDRKHNKIKKVNLYINRILMNQKIKRKLN